MINRSTLRGFVLIELLLALCLLSIALTVVTRAQLEITKIARASDDRRAQLANLVFANRLLHQPASGLAIGDGAALALKSPVAPTTILMRCAAGTDAENECILLLPDEVWRPADFGGAGYLAELGRPAAWPADK